MRIILLFFICLPLLADEEIIVHLSSQESLNPIYITSIKDQGSGFDKSYHESIAKVLRFDFEHDGKSALVSAQKGACTIDLEIKQKILSVKLTNASGNVKGIEGLELSGELAKDRMIVHRIHDALFEELYKEKGIAETHLLYTVKNRKNDQPDGWASDIWIADYDGANAKQVTHDGCLCVTPTFLPAQSQGRCNNFLYVSYKIGQPKIFAMALGESAGKRLTFLRGNQLMPTISPTLDKIAFISDITGNPDLFVQDFSMERGLVGKPRQVFCSPGATQGTPTFSPDGKKLAFVSNKDGTPRIYILDIPAPGASLKNIQPKMISKKTRENTCPAWSPDGKMIAYSALSSGVRQIWIYYIKTGDEMQLTDGYGHKENPAWASDALHVVFNSTTPTTSDLFMINLNQKKAVKITSGPGEKRFPTWEPVTRNQTQRKL